MTKLDEDNWKNILIRYQQKEIEALRSEIEQLQAEVRTILKIQNTDADSEVSKLKIFIDAYSALSLKNPDGVSEGNFRRELLRTGRFSEKEIDGFITKAVENGQLYYRTEGVLAKT